MTCLAGAAAARHRERASVACEGQIIDPNRPTSLMTYLDGVVEAVVGWRVGRKARIIGTRVLKVRRGVYPFTIRSRRSLPAGHAVSPPSGSRRPARLFARAAASCAHNAPYRSMRRAFQLDLELDPCYTLLFSDWERSGGERSGGERSGGPRRLQSALSH